MTEQYEEDLEDNFEDLEEIDQLDEISGIGNVADNKPGLLARAAGAAGRAADEAEKTGNIQLAKRKREQAAKFSTAGVKRDISGGIKESAVDTLKPNSNPDTTDSKSALMAAALAAIGGMSKEDLSHFLNDALAQSQKGADAIDAGAAAKNAATIATKPSAASSAVKEDLNELFGEDLSEEFKDQASTLFEAAVQARVIVETAALEEAFEQALNEQVAEITEALSEKVDTYLSYVAEEWVKENEVAIESALKVEVMEEFIEGLKNLFVENYIEVPAGKDDVLSDLVDTVESLEGKLNDVLNENIELKKNLNEKVMDETFAEVAEGLAATQIEKFRTLAEGVEFNSVEDYKKKLSLIRGKLVEKRTVSTNIITEEASGVASLDEEGTQSVGYTDPSIKNYVSAIARTVKK